MIILTYATPLLIRIIALIKKEKQLLSEVFDTRKKQANHEAFDDVQRCPSGLRCSPGKAVCKKLHQEFESLSLRHIFNLRKNKWK